MFVPVGYFGAAAGEWWQRVSGLTHFYDFTDENKMNVTSSLVYGAYDQIGTDDLDTKLGANDIDFTNPGSGNGIKFNRTNDTTGGGIARDGIPTSIQYGNDFTIVNIIGGGYTGGSDDIVFDVEGDYTNLVVRTNPNIIGLGGANVNAVQMGGTAGSPYLQQFISITAPGTTQGRWLFNGYVAGWPNVSSDYYMMAISVEWGSPTTTCQVRHSYNGGNWVDNTTVGNNLQTGNTEGNQPSIGYGGRIRNTGGGLSLAEHVSNEHAYAGLIYNKVLSDAEIGALWTAYVNK